MLKVYLVGIPSYNEYDSIEIRYKVLENDQQLMERSIKKDYQKPVVVSLYSLMLLLKDLKKFEKQEIQIFMNDSAIKEQVGGTTTTKNQDVLKLAGMVRELLKKFDSIEVKDISKDSKVLGEWNQILGAD